MAAHGVADRMPTNRELRGSGHNSLAIAIGAYHGGYLTFAKRMGCVCWQPQSRCAQHVRLQGRA